MGRLGYVSFGRDGEFDISGGRFQSFFTDVKMAGQLFRGWREDEWGLSMSYSVMPSAGCWVLAILGFIFLLFGPLLLLIPFTVKSNVQRAVGQAVRGVRYEVEGDNGRRR